MAAPQASSRLELLQARFQQKQLQEKEQKLLQLYDQQQQRAYQVVQRGSPGSNSSNHATSISQHTDTKTANSSHTTSTSQGGKVRQMFDERRQTTVKGIDRSYPLEPLENKPRKQTNGNGVQKNGISTVNRQSVTVKRVARADVNSNSNGGKPVVSYHEEIARESFGPSARQQQDEDEFGNENHVARYANGNHRDEQTHIEEVLDEDTIERNRMMAKLHLMEYDETLKHRVKNDLESEEFPEDFMVDVPDKLPKQSVTKKLSPAEARLERFKNTNAKRSNNVTKNQTTVPKKRSDPIFPAKSTSSEDRMVKTMAHKVSKERSSGGSKSPGKGKSKAKTVASEQVEETISSSESEKNRKRKDESPRSIRRKSEKSVTTCTIDSKPSKLSSELLADRTRRSISPSTFSTQSEKSGTVYEIDSDGTKEVSSRSLKNVERRSETPTFFCKESEKSATTYAIDSKSAKKLPQESKDRTPRSVSPKYFCKESEKSAATFAIDPKTIKKLSPESTKIISKRSEGPKFICKETEKSATTHAIDSKTSGKLSPEFSRVRTTRSPSPHFLCKESDKSATAYEIGSKTTQKLPTELSRNRIPRSPNPDFFNKESKKSTTTCATDSRSRVTSPDLIRDTKRAVSKVEPKNRNNECDSDTIKDIICIDTVDRRIRSKSGTISRSPSPNNTENYMKLEKQKETKSSNLRPNRSSNVFERLTRERSSSPKFVCRESKTSAATMRVGTKDSKFTSKSPELKESSVQKHGACPRVSPLRHETVTSHTTRTVSPEFLDKTFRKSSTSPQFYGSDSERSASVLMVTPETITKPRPRSPEPKRREQSPESNISKSEIVITSTVTAPRKITSEESRDEDSRRFIRSSVSRFFSEQCEKASREAACETGDNVQSAEADKKLHLSRGSSPLSLKDMRTPSSTGSKFYLGGTRIPDKTSIDRRSSSRESSPRSQKTVDNRDGTPEIFLYESEKSATTVSLKSRPSTVSKNQASRNPKSISHKIAYGSLTKSKSPVNKLNNAPSKSPNHITALKDNSIRNRRGSGNILRSTKLIRDAIRSQYDRNQGDYTPAKHRKGSRSSSTMSEDTNGMSNESKQPSNGDETEEEVVANRKADKRAGAFAARELLTVESSPKSSTSAEVDTEIREITMPDRYVKQEHPRGTYSRSSNKSGGGESSTEKLFTYSVRKPSKKRESLLESNVFEPSTRYRRDVCDLSEEKQVGSGRRTKDTSSSPSSTNESIVGGSKRRTGKGTVNGRDESKILKSRRRTPSPIRMKGKKISLEEAIGGKSNKTNDDSGKSTVQNRWSSSPSPTNESLIHDPKRRIEENTGHRKSEVEASKSREQTPSPRLQKEWKTNLRGVVSDESKKRGTPSPRVSKQARTLTSMELVRRAMKGSNFQEEKRSREISRGTSGGFDQEEQIKIPRSPSSSTSTVVEIVESESNIVSAKEAASSGKNYERTDSVESALRRFDSIGTESVRSTLERSKESITEKRQTESNKAEGSRGDSKTISLKALDRPNVNLRRSPEKSEPSRTPSGRTLSTSENVESSCKKRRSETQETGAQKKFLKARDSIEIARIAIRSKSPTCKRKLFQDADSGEETESGSSKSKSSLDSSRTVERFSSWSNKNETPDSVGTVSTQFEFTVGAESPIGKIDKGKTKETSTGADRSLSVKQLRSIEDIRKSIEGESSNRKAMGTSRKSAIANNTAGRSGPGRINIDDRAGNRKGISLPRRSENVAARSDALGDADRSSVKCTMRFSRVAKSPSPETTKGTETSGRVRKNVAVSPSKSPDTVVRRPSTELKAQDTKSTKRPTPMKGTEPIGNRKTTTSSTTRKSTDVVDGAIFENGLHLRDQTAETKYDNDSPTTKKSDAFVIDFDEQPPKESDTPLPRKQLLRKRSTEKQITSMQSTRPPSSTSSGPSGSSIQGQTSGSRSKMAARGKTPVSSKSNHSKSGVNACATEQLVPCKICGRRFAQDRIGLHEQICVKTGQKKRKQFDTMMYRVRGTDLEPFVKKALAHKPKPEKSKKPEVKSNWRRKHEDFINAIRSAKQVQAHLAAGGKLSDLPPPPVSDNCDYIQCPHCGRKFNKAAADRHIPKCEHMLHNKPLHARLPKPRR